MSGAVFLQYQNRGIGDNSFFSTYYNIASTSSGIPTLSARSPRECPADSGKMTTSPGEKSRVRRKNRNLFLGPKLH